MGSAPRFGGGQAESAGPPIRWASWPHGELQGPGVPGRPVEERGQLVNLGDDALPQFPMCSEKSPGPHWQRKAGEGGTLRFCFRGRGQQTRSAVPEGHAGHSGGPRRVGQARPSSGRPRSHTIPHEPQYLQF